MNERLANAVARFLSAPVPFRSLRRAARNWVRFALCYPPGPGDARRRREFARAFDLASEPPERVELPAVGDPLVSIVIPVYNNFRLTMLCLDSIVRNTRGESYEVVLADDASTDETMRISECVSGLVVVRSTGNLRFLRNCNSAAKVAKGKYILFLNNDTQVQPGWLAPLVAQLEADPRVGLVGSMLLNPDGSIQEVGMSMDREGQAVARAGGCRAPWRRSFRGPRDADYVSGASMMLRRDLWERLQGFDELYAPAYYEDADLAFRVRKSGLRVVCEPASKVVHCCGATAGQRGAFQVNRRKFVDRWFGGAGA